MSTTPPRDDSTRPAGLTETKLEIAVAALIEQAKRAASPPAGGDPPSADLDVSARPRGDAADAATDAIPGFEILERIYQGGQGVVYRAVQLSTRRPVAIKVMRIGRPTLDIRQGGTQGRAESQRLRFIREVAIISRLHHPNIVTVFDSGAVDGRLYFAMEFVDGQPIDDHALLCNLSARDSLRLFIEVCRAVKYAHQNGVIHRDLKPSNILIDTAGQPRILDFGLAKDTMAGTASAPAETVSVTGQIVGTLPYLSPEQAAGRSHDVDVRSDVYALGVILYQILTRRFPYDVTGNPDDVRAAIIGRAPLPLRRALMAESIATAPGDDAMLADLERVLDRALEKERDRRYQTAGDLADELERCLKGEPVQARQQDRLYLLRKTLRAYRTHVIIGGAFMMLLVVASVGVLLAWRRAENVARIATDGLTMGSFIRLASVARDSNRIDDAVALYEKAIEIGERSTTDDPVVVRMAVTAYCELGKFHADFLRFGELDDSVRRASELSQQLLRLAPDDPMSHYWRAKVLALHGFGCNERQTAGAAGLPSLVEAREIFARLWEQDPGNTLFAKESAAVLTSLGRCLEDLGSTSDAYQAHCTALDLLTFVVEQNPWDIDAFLDICRIEINLAAWHINRRTPADYHAAMDYSAHAERLLTELGAAGKLTTRLSVAEPFLRGVRKNYQLAQKRLLALHHPGERRPNR